MDKAVVRRISSLAKGCITWKVPDNRYAPLLHRGDFAVFDTARRVPVSGRWYLLAYESGHRWLAEIRVTQGRLVNASSEKRWKLGVGPRAAWWTHPIVRPRSVAEIREWQKRGRPISTSDGPLEKESLADLIAGQFMGVLVGADALMSAERRHIRDRAREDGLARKAAEHFDAEMYVADNDQIGSLVYLQEFEGRVGIITALVGGGKDPGEIYADHSLNFGAYSRGRRWSIDRVAQHLRATHRIVRIAADGSWEYDPAFPKTVRNRLELDREQLQATLH